MTDLLTVSSSGGFDLKFDFSPQTLTAVVHSRQQVWNPVPGFRPAIKYLSGQRTPIPDNQWDAFSFRQTEGVKIYFDEAAEIQHTPFQSGVGKGIKSTYSGFTYQGQAISLAFETLIWIDDTYGRLHFEWIPLCDDPGVLQVIYPAPFQLVTHSAEACTVIPMMQGCMIPNDWKEKVETIAPGLYCSRAAYMPWWGQVDKKEAYIAIAETPWDGGYLLDHPAGGPTVITPVWYPSLGAMRYSRRMVYEFLQGDYNDLCKIYRQYIDQKGGLRTLAEKAVANPNLRRLIGSPVIHSSILYHIQPDSAYYNTDAFRKGKEVNDDLITFDQRIEELCRLKEKGVDKAYLHLDGWGSRGYDNLHPDYLPPCEAAGGWDGMRRLSEICEKIGYLFATHDQYRDYYKDAATYSDEYAVHCDTGQIPHVAFWYGGDQAFLCAKLAPDYVRRNFEALKRNGVHLTATYLDVFAVVELDECFYPEHLMTRKECLESRAECFNYVRSEHIISSSEEAVDWAVPYMDLVHHAPYALAGGWDSGEGRGIPVPLFNLVYHDCLVIPWAMSTGGWGIPGSDRGYLHGLLNGGTSYLSIDADDAEIKMAKVVCEFQEKVAYAEMLRHEFLDASMRRQRATYANGMAVEVDFDRGTYQITGG